MPTHPPVCGCLRGPWQDDSTSPRPRQLACRLTGPPLPVTCLPSGAVGHGGHYHSQSPEAFFTHIPGIQVTRVLVAHPSKVAE